MALKKISDAEMDAAGVCAAPDVLSGTPAENKQVFDRMVRQLVAPAYNAAVDAVNEINDTEAGIKTAESKRQTAEAGRVAAEKKRVTAETARQTAETARQNAETAREDKETGYVADAEAWAKGTRNGVPVANNDPTYENNARYFKEQASAVVGGEFVSFGRAQALTPVQRVQAQQNIGVTWACNPNLLRNWYFPRPVNQRDVSGTISTAGYFLDGWKLVSGAVTIGTDGITLNGTMTQVLEHAPAGTVTASVLTPEGVGKVVPVYDSTAKTFTITAAGKKLLAAKLELGSVQTLAHQDSSGAWVLNEIPDYAEQLRRCQRYLYVQKANTRVNASGVLTTGKTTIFFGVTVPVPMRALPTLLVAPSVVQVRTTAGGNVDPVVSSVSVYAQSSFDAMITLRAATETFNADGYTNNTPLSLFVENLQLSAEL